MPSKSANVKNEKQYEALKDKGMSKERAARIANSEGASSRGGKYFGNPAMEALEHQESYLQTVFGFFGVTDVRFVRAEGVAMGPDARAQALSSADADIQVTRPTRILVDPGAELLVGVGLMIGEQCKAFGLSLRPFFDNVGEQMLGRGFDPRGQFDRL